MSDASEYQRSLIELRNAIVELKKCRTTTRTYSSLKPTRFSERESAPMFVWLGLPNLIPWQLNTDRKRRVMTRDQARRYHKACNESGLVGVNGPCFEIEMDKISGGCGNSCTRDGMHYNDATFESCVTIILNMGDLGKDYFGLLRTWYVRCMQHSRVFSFHVELPHRDMANEMVFAIRIGVAFLTGVCNPDWFLHSGLLFTNQEVNYRSLSFFRSFFLLSSKKGDGLRSRPWEVWVSTLASYP